MKIPLFQVDAFTGKLFGGNPAAVCPLKNWLPDDIMQKIAAENNLAETAFFVPGVDHFELRWFTPEVEVNLCGHSTLASGHVIFNHLGHRSNQIRFSSKSGDLIVTRDGQLLTLDFPTSRPQSTVPPDGLIDALGAKPLEIYKARDLLAVYETEDDILAIKPNFEKLRRVDMFAVIITAPGKECDFVSRFFAPRVGINEDPVTGSAHTTLIPYWSERLGKVKLHALQLSKRRGELFCEYCDDRVHISGRAVTYLIGDIEI